MSPIDGPAAPMSTVVPACGCSTSVMVVASPPDMEPASGIAFWATPRSPLDAVTSASATIVSAERTRMVGTPFLFSSRSDHCGPAAVDHPTGWRLEHPSLGYLGRWRGP